MNDRKRQQRRAADMLIRSKGLEKCNLSIIIGSLNHLPEALAPVVKTIGEFVERLRVVPSEQCGEPVNVIRCKDCIHYDNTPYDWVGPRYCECLGCYRQGDFYCAYGRRR
jgi:hypothetical protein